MSKESNIYSTASTTTEGHNMGHSSRKKKVVKDRDQQTAANPKKEQSETNRNSHSTPPTPPPPPTPQSGESKQTLFSLTSPEQFIDALLQLLDRLWLQVRRMAGFVMSELGGNELVDSIAIWCVHNPHLAICLLAGGLVFLLPFLIIFGFGIATMLMTFTGLLVLEGTLLTIVSMMFFACLGGLAIIVPVIGIVLAAAYFGLVQIYNFYGTGKERPKKALSHLVKIEPIVKE